MSCRSLMLLLLLGTALPYAQASAEMPAADTPPATFNGPMPSPDEVLAIPSGLSALLHARVIAPGNGREERLQRLAEMIFDRDGMDLQYDADATYTVAETWQYRRANCLSFTLLFVTLARESGIQARVQEVEQVVSWYQDAGALYSVGHVNAGIGINGREATVDLDRNVLYDRQGPRPISDARALAHFYNNRGAAQMEAGDVQGARAYLQASLRQADDFTAALNNLGVLESRQGHLSLAKAYYLRALQAAPRHVASLANASALLARLGEARQAARLQLRLQNVRQGDPFIQYGLGVQAERAGDADRAIRFYRRAIRLYGSAHQFHFALARAYVMSGNLPRADHELMRAQELGGTALQTRYQEKLDSLQRWRRQQASLRVH
ncbi:UDP-N-acetylglucosamine-peptide N-acetylglucosaminyltransferase [Stenotrophomonas tumulicola]|uniref:UDP-N-acetylglucosamine-peptide N-acetylglucosaminyltransferase n=2 Tax=Stenotrophomonas tumulicola TaxID=1685415 RepID=A0A7W3IGK6_9GAMM|nr:UDP-N-acetylglucosamine-peptide N-acetylglucosaminyltransferase [Stenotrophomonas tumulicola]